PWSRSPGPSGKRARPSRGRRWPSRTWGPPLERRKPPCPRSKRPPGPRGRKRTRISRVGTFFFFVDLLLFVTDAGFLCSERRQKVADETAAKEAVHTALTAAQVELAELEQTAVSVCQELEGEG